MHCKLSHTEARTLRYTCLFIVGLAACSAELPETVDSGIADAGVTADVGLIESLFEAGPAHPDIGVADGGPFDAGAADAGAADAGIHPDSPEGRGLALYTEYCGFCHGASGEGYWADNANALANPEFLASATDFFLWASILDGRPGTPMSPWGQSHSGPLSEEDAWDLVAYIRLWQDLPSVDVEYMQISGDADSGQAVYERMQCGACHGADGEGVLAMSLNNPVFHQFASDGFIYHAIAKGRAPTTMPAYEDVLTEQEMQDLVAYIRTWSRPVVPPDNEQFTPDWTDHVINEGGTHADFTPRVVEREGAEFNDEFVSAQQVYDAMLAGQSFVLVDARVIPDYLIGHINGAVSVPFDSVDRAAEVITRERWVITYCGCPHAVSGRARAAFKRAGFERVAVLDEGYYYWTDEGWPACGGRERYCEE